MNLAIIGCGVIGRYHLKSVLNSNLKNVNIFVIDIFKDNLDECKKIARLKKKINIYYLSYVDETDKNFDFVIIANNSIDRFKAIQDLYYYKKPKFIILEKFLFDNLASYKKAKIMFDSINTKVWVNQWMGIGFAELSNTFSEVKNFKMIIKGTNWNLCSNSVHFIDWFHLISSRKKIRLIKAELENLVVNSKRSGFYETFGSLNFKSANNELLLNCKYKKKSNFKIFISISSESKNIECEFTGDKLIGSIHFKKNKKKFKINIQYLSERTSDIIYDILKKGECLLPTYDQSVIHHKLIFQTFIKHFNKNGLKNNNLAIT